MDLQNIFFLAASTMRNKHELQHIYKITIYSNDASSCKSPRIGAPGLRETCQVKHRAGGELNGLPTQENSALGRGRGSMRCKQDEFSERMGDPPPSSWRLRALRNMPLRVTLPAT